MLLGSGGVEAASRWCRRRRSGRPDRDGGGGRAVRL